MRFSCRLAGASRSPSAVASISAPPFPANAHGSISIASGSGVLIASVPRDAQPPVSIAAPGAISTVPRHHIRCSRRRPRRQGLASTDRESDPAQLLEPRIAVKLMVARHDRPRRRRQDRTRPNSSPRRHPKFALEAEPNEARRLLRRKPFNRPHINRHPPAALARVDLRDDSFHANRPDLFLQYRRRDQCRSYPPRRAPNPGASQKRDHQRQQPCPAPPDQNPRQRSRPSRQAYHPPAGLIRRRHVGRRPKRQRQQ